MLWSFSRNAPPPDLTTMLTRTNQQQLPNTKTCFRIIFKVIFGFGRRGWGRAREVSPIAACFRDRNSHTINAKIAFSLLSRNRTIDVTRPWLYYLKKKSVEKSFRIELRCHCELFSFTIMESLCIYHTFFILFVFTLRQFGALRLKVWTPNKKKPLTCQSITRAVQWSENQSKCSGYPRLNKGWFTQSVLQRMRCQSALTTAPE